MHTQARAQSLTNYYHVMILGILEDIVKRRMNQVKK